MCEKNIPSAPESKVETVEHKKIHTPLLRFILSKHPEFYLSRSTSTYHLNPPPTAEEEPPVAAASLSCHPNGVLPRTWTDQSRERYQDKLDMLPRAAWPGGHWAHPCRCYGLQKGMQFRAKVDDSENIVAILGPLESQKVKAGDIVTIDAVQYDDEDGVMVRFQAPFGGFWLDSISSSTFDVLTKTFTNMFEYMPPPRGM